MTRVLPGHSGASAIEDVVARIADWRGKSIAVHALTNGLTNTNYRVDVEGTPFVVRIPGASTELLAVDRQNEYHNTLIAAQVGVGAKVAHYLPDTHVMILEFIHGRTMSNADLQAPGMPSRIARSLRVLHAGQRFFSDFSMFRLVDFYLETVARHDIRIPDSYRDRLPAIRRIERALAARPLPTAPCHNDLLADNYIDDGHLLRLVDYEYSGNNDPAFELGNTCQELLYDEPRITELCVAYFGAASPRLLARVKLNMIVSDVGWTLWAAIQTRISRIAFDFWGYGVNRWGRAEANIDSPEFPVWLEAVQGPG